jgi:molybdenum-dependent DNA-binding transcriptional regulator ModE
MRGQKITPKQIEQIKAIYAETESLTAAAKAVGVSWATAEKYAKSSDEFEELRVEKRTVLIGSIAAELAEVRQLYLNRLKEPGVIAETSARDAALIIGITTDKFQLVTGEATERSEHVHTDDARARLAGKTDELAARRATRSDLQSDGSRG